MPTTPTPADRPADVLRAAAEVLGDAESYLSALHGAVARHDNLGADLTCGGCQLRDRITPALAVARQVLGTTTGQPETATADVERRTDIADSVTAHTKALLARRTETLRKRAESAEVERDQLRAERTELIRQRDQIAMDTVKALPAPADRATVLREAAEVARQLGDDMGEIAAPGARLVADRLRRLAAEAQQPTPDVAEETK